MKDKNIFHASLFLYLYFVNQGLCLRSSARSKISRGLLLAANRGSSCLPVRDEVRDLWLLYDNILEKVKGVQIFLQIP